MLAPESTRVPAPAFVRPAAEATGVAMVAVAFVPSALTVTVGLPVVTESDRPLEASPLPSSVQLAAEAVLVSPKTRLPMVRGASRRTVLFAAMFSMLKSAVEFVPLATTPLSQLPPSLHRPPLAVLSHVPLALLVTL
jgi:hypothetical protein